MTIYKQVLVDIETRDCIDLSLPLEGISHMSKKRKKVCIKSRAGSDKVSIYNSCSSSLAESVRLFLCICEHTDTSYYNNYTKFVMWI